MEEFWGVGCDSMMEGYTLTVHMRLINHGQIGYCLQRNIIGSVRSVRSMGQCGSAGEGCVNLQLR